MIEVNLFKDKLVGLFGLGITGISAYKALKQGGARVIIWDDNKKTRDNFIAKLNYHFNKYTLEQDFANLNDPRWNEIETLILSPGVPTYYPKPHKVVEIARKRNIKIICDIELLYQANRYTDIIAITGTNGKSTTTSLTGHILKTAKINSQVGGNIGDAVLELDKLRAGGIYVVECSSFQLELIDKFKPKISILLNITPDHLDRYKTMQDYIDAKCNIFAMQNQQDIAIIGVDNEISRGIYERLSISRKIGEVIPFSVEKELDYGSYIKNSNLIINLGKKQKINITENKFLLGIHNKENMLASATAAYLSGATIKQIEQALANFVGLKHRMEYLGEKKGVSFVNDSKATNIESTEKALSSYKNIIWIAGGYIKGEFEIDKLTSFFPNIKQAFLIGSSAELLAKELAGKVQSQNCRVLDKAFEKAVAVAKKGDVILLSPAFASLDQFKNYAHRGECFRKLYEKY